MEQRSPNVGNEGVCTSPCVLTRSVRPDSSRMVNSCGISPGLLNNNPVHSIGSSTLRPSAGIYEPGAHTGSWRPEVNAEIRKDHAHVPFLLPARLKSGRLCRKRHQSSSHCIMQSALARSGTCWGLGGLHPVVPTPSGTSCDDTQALQLYQHLLPL
jgi:hypothetical protein